MAAKDAVTKEYMGNAAVFADAFNYLLYEGRPVIEPEKLHAMDTAEIAVPYGEGETARPTQKYRDNLKYLTAMEDGKAAYLVLGVEAQSEVAYAPPARLKKSRKRSAAGNFWAAFIGGTVSCR